MLFDRFGNKYLLKFTIRADFLSAKDFIFSPKQEKMKVTLNRIEKEYHFEARGASGVPVQIDTTLDGPSKGASPMELILMGLGGCNAIDIVNILLKQKQEITGYQMEITGERKEVEQAQPFSAAHIKIFLEGKIDAKRAARAARLSFEKYCSVSMTLQNVKVTYSILLNGKEIAL